jgi:predicted nuclease of predicted toxin-antitoxin system
VAAPLRLVADENLPRLLVTALRAASHDVLWIRDQHRSMPDAQVLALASQQQRILITGDKDFGDLVFVERQPAPHGVILIRVADALPSDLAQLVVEALARETEWGGFFSVLGDGRLRRSVIERDP